MPNFCFLEFSNIYTNFWNLTWNKINRRQQSPRFFSIDSLPKNKAGWCITAEIQFRKIEFSHHPSHNQLMHRCKARTPKPNYLDHWSWTSRLSSNRKLVRNEHSWAPSNTHCIRKLWRWGPAICHFNKPSRGFERILKLKNHWIYITYVEFTGGVSYNQRKN